MTTIIRIFSSLTTAALLLASVSAASASDKAHIGHLLESWKGTSSGNGILVALEDQLNVAKQHAVFAASAKSTESVKTHLQHVVNTLVGSDDGRFMKDVMNPGDGKGVITYVDDAQTHLELAADQDHASKAVDVHAAHVAKALSNVEGWVDRAVIHSELGQSADSHTKALDQANRVLRHLTRAIDGEDGDGNGDVSWEEGGVKTAIQHTGFMKR